MGAGNKVTPFDAQEAWRILGTRWPTVPRSALVLALFRDTLPRGAKVVIEYEHVVEVDLTAGTAD